MMMDKWSPIASCPEETWVLTWASWDDPPKISIKKYRYIEYSEWETVSESSGAPGARRQIRQEKIIREREWSDGGTMGGEYWMTLPLTPEEQPRE